MNDVPRLERDPAHWLLRLDVDEWLRAADGELARTASAAAAHQRRTYVAGARRAAGMAFNAVLLQTCLNEGVMPEQSSMASYGRSYMDHVRRLQTDEDEPDDVRAAASALLEVSPDRQELVTLSSRKEPDRIMDAASRLITRARELVAQLTTPVASA